jgi:hypothetical protein
MPDFNRTELSAAPASIAINALLEAGARADAEQTRNYLGASAVGHPCLRKVQFDWMSDPTHPARLRDIFARGHFFEEQSRQHFARHCDRVWLIAHWSAIPKRTPLNTLPSSAATLRNSCRAKRLMPAYRLA